LILQGVVDLSSWLHGGVRLVYVRDYARAHIESSESGVYDSDGTSYLSCSCGSCIPYPGGGYVVECSAFYERGFGAPPHRFLYLLLQFYGLELHHFTPSGNLHIAAFITLYEAYMGIEPHFNLWNYFFRVWLRPDSKYGSDGVGLHQHLCSHWAGVDPYFCLSVSNPTVG
jgi:hypothetical protein